MEPKLLKNSEWMRVYATGPDELRYESKFLGDEVQVTAEEIMRRWTDLSPSEQLEFSSAFSAKLSWTEEDRKILDFLMEVGDEYIMQTIVDLIARHCEKKRAAAFLLRRMQGTGNFPRANYYWALGTVGDPESVPHLRQIYDQYSDELKGTKGKLLTTPSGYVDYLRLCATLRKLDGSPEFEDRIHEMLSHSDEGVRACARRLLNERNGSKQ